MNAYIICSTAIAVATITPLSILKSIDQVPSDSVEVIAVAGLDMKGSVFTAVRKEISLPEKPSGLETTACGLSALKGSWSAVLWVASCLMSASVGTLCDSVNVEDEDEAEDVDDRKDCGFPARTS